MIGSVKTELLKHLVVRVDSPDGKILGSGFYAAPGWVLTAAHVADGLSRVRLTPATGGEPIDAEVVARSDTREAEAPSGFWPFPDLAIIRFDQAREHPSAFVEAASPEGDSTCTAWGYARREKGQDPVGSPAKFEFVGFEGDGWLSLKSDAVRHGMSGAPLVCPARRAVVGVMSVTRDPDSSLGGWASPIEALTGALPGVPEALVVEGRKLLEASRAEAVRHRMAWHGVIPIQDAENVLERSWGTYRGGGHPDPADLLLAEYRVVPYLFRDDDLNTLEAWCQAPEPIKVGLAAGVGGGGKTRLAVELCHRMVETHGWVVVGEISRFGEGGQRGLSDIYTSLRQISLPRLIVLDYAEDRVPSEVAALIGQLRSGATDVAPVRLMLLTRDAERPRHVSLIDSIKDDATVSVKQIIQDLERSDAAEKGLSLDERNRLYRCAVERFASAWGAEPPDGSPALSSPDQAEPLGVLFTALDAVLSSSEAAGMGVGSSWGRDPAERILRHEEKCWRMGAPDETADVLRRCIAVATLAGARDAAEADQLLECLPELARDENRGRRRSLIGWLSRLYKGVGVLNPLRPDRLGEALVIHTLVDEPDDEVIETILRSGSPSQCARTVTVLTRCSARAGLARQVLVALLSKLHMHLTLKAEVCAHGSRDREGDYTLASALVTALNGGLSEDLTRREPDNTGYQRDVSVSL
ncbi:Trypsin-like peptidase domain-containing protein, partial [Tessaracoccus bendigoensis DSM 12906]